MAKKPMRLLVLCCGLIIIGATTTMDPTLEPTTDPTLEPTMTTSSPTSSPTSNPSETPSSSPTSDPTPSPTKAPTVSPSYAPTSNPTASPTAAPTVSPSVAPTQLCDTLLVTIHSINIDGNQYNDATQTIVTESDGNVSAQHWNGHYIEDETRTSYQRPIWIHAQTNGYMFWQPNAWRLVSGLANQQLFHINDERLQPPLDETSSWVLATNFNISFDIELQCSASTAPTATPTDIPTTAPTVSPAFSPSNNPTSAPTDIPTQTPTSIPTETPTDSPTFSPTISPTASPTEIPTAAPSHAPTFSPTFSPTAFCELLRVRVVNVSDANAVGDEVVIYEDYQSAFDSSFEQQSLILNFRTQWLRWSDGATVQYDSGAYQWVITVATFDVLTFSSRDTLPPVAAYWQSMVNPDISVFVTTECVVYTPSPTTEPTESPSRIPTNEPTIATTNPTVQPSLSPTTVSPTTATPTRSYLSPLNNNSVCVEFEIELEFRVIGNVFGRSRIAQFILDSFADAVQVRTNETWKDDLWCIRLPLINVTDTASQSVPLRRVLTDDDEGEAISSDAMVMAQVTFNEPLYADYFHAYHKQEFRRQLRQSLTAEMQMEDDAVMVTGLTVQAAAEITTTAGEEPEAALQWTDDCGLFQLLCWQLLVVAFALLVSTVLFIFAFCYFTKKEVKKLERMPQQKQGDDNDHTIKNLQNNRIMYR